MMLCDIKSNYPEEGKMNTQSNKKTPRVAIILLSVLALFQIVRLFAFTIIQDALAGKVAESWTFPAMMDVFVGACALFVALGIWRGKGLAPWVSAIVFFCLSISDHIDAMTVTLTSKGPAPAMMSGSGVIPQLVVMSILEIIALWALTTKTMREHYLADNHKSA
jgi:hypothetical protein